MSRDDPNNPRGGDFGRVDPDSLNFRYNRARRLEQAPDIVRETYRRGYTPNKGFIKGLTANAGLRSILFVIVLLSVVIVGLSVFADNPDTARLPGATARLKAFLYGDTVYVSLSIEPEKGATGALLPVSASIVGLDAAGEAVANQSVSGTWAGQTYVLRAPLRDYELTKVRVALRFGETDAELVAAVDRN